MNRVVWSNISDLYRTPQPFFDEYDREFGFVLDAAADKHTTKCKAWLGPGSPIYKDALHTSWKGTLHREKLAGAIWWNCPYSQCAAFVAKAAEERRQGVTSVGLIPSRTDTRWFHEHIWNRLKHRPRKGIELRPVKGRLRFSLRVTPAMRRRVKSAPTVREAVLSKRLGLPRLIIRCIRAAEPVAVESAPFPSLVVIFNGTVK